MGSVVVNAVSFETGLRRESEKLDKLMSKRVRLLMNAAMVRLLRRTPVHTGQAAMNYVATAKNPYGGPAKSAGKPVEPTNRLPLGSEKLRPAAEEVSRQTLTTVDYTDPYTDFWIVNKSPNISGLEAGELPRAPFTPRSPQGMFAVTLQELISLLESDRLR